MFHGCRICGSCMRVLFYNHTTNISGAERVLLLALKRLDRKEIEPFVVCPEGDLSRECTQLGVPVQVIRELNARFTLRPDKLAIYFLSLLKTVRELKNEIIRAQVDAIHANSIRAGIAALFATLGTGHIVFWHVHDELKPHPVSSAIRLLVRASRRCRVIAVSDATASSFIGITLRGSQVTNPVVVIHNAVELENVDQNSKRQDLRKELGIERDSFLFGIVGQITPRKGQLELVKIFAKAAKGMPSAKLLIVGKPIFNDDNIYHAKVAEAINVSGLTDRVRFLGQRSDSVRIIRDLDALVINSSSEAFVMVAIEAMACGTPVIATDVGGTREMIQHRFNGWLIDHGDEGQLVDALITAYQDKESRQLFAERSRNIVEERLNAPRFIGEFQSALLSARKDDMHGLSFAPAVLKARAYENQ